VNLPTAISRVCLCKVTCLVPAAVAAAGASHGEQWVSNVGSLTAQSNIYYKLVDRCSATCNIHTYAIAVYL